MAQRFGLSGAAGAIPGEAGGSFIFNSIKRNLASEPIEPLGL